VREVRWSVWVPLLVFLGTAIVYCATISRLPSWDAETANLASWHIGRTGNPDLPLSDYPNLMSDASREQWLVRDADGNDMIGRAPGVIAAGVPAYWLLGGADFSVLPGGLSAALLSAAAMTWLFVLLSRLSGRRTALVATLVVAFTTPVWSVAADAMWPHTVTVLGMVGMAAAARADRWGWVGFWAGVAATGRLHVALVCVVLALGCALHRRQWRPVLQAGTAGLAWVGLISLWTHWMYGKWDPTSAYDTNQFTAYAAGHRVDLVNLLGFFVSPHRGLFLWSPVILVLLPALVRAWRTLPDWSRWLCLGGLAYLAVQGLLNRFSGGFFFYGYRLQLEAVVCATPALVLSWSHAGRVARALLVPVVIVQGALVIPGSLTDLYTPEINSWTTNGLWYWLQRKPAAVLGLVLASGVATALAARIVSARAASPVAGVPTRVESRS
jgi:alpha-1,2-mannosyltransferase